LCFYVLGLFALYDRLPDTSNGFQAFIGGSDVVGDLPEGSESGFVRSRHSTHKDFPDNWEEQFQDFPQAQTFVCNVEHPTVCHVDFLGFVLYGVKIVVEARQAHDIERRAGYPKSHVDLCPFRCQTA